MCLCGGRLDAPPQDQGAGELDQGQVVAAPAGVAGADGPEAFEPREGPLDHPAPGGVSLLPGADVLLFADPTEVRRVAQADDFQFDPRVVIAFVQAQMLGVGRRRGWLDHARLDRWGDESAVVDVSPHHHDGGGEAVLVDQEVQFAAVPPAVRGVAAQSLRRVVAGLADRRLHQAAVHRLPGPFEAAEFLVGFRPETEQRGEDAPSHPPLKMLVDRALRAITARQETPLAARLEHVEDPVHDLPELQRLRSARFPALERLQQRFRLFPKAVGYLMVAHTTPRRLAKDTDFQVTHG